MSASDVIDAVAEIIERGGDSEDVLQAVVTAIVDRGSAKWAAVLLNDEGELVVAAHAGVAEPGERRTAPVVSAGAQLGELAVDGLDDQSLIERVASLITPYCNRSAWLRGRVARVIEGDDALAIIDLISDAYIGTPFPMRSGNVFVIEPEAQGSADLTIHG